MSTAPNISADPGFTILQDMEDSGGDARDLGQTQINPLREMFEREDGEELAFGSLLTDPQRGARLEVKHASGFVERQLRRGRAL